MDGIEMSEKMICCFCGESVDIDKTVVLQVYPFYNSDEFQQLYCHKKCLTDKMDKTIPQHPDLIEDE